MARLSLRRRAAATGRDRPTPAHLLEVSDLRVEFATDDGIVHAVNGVSFHVDAGETLAIVGESGSGKSVSVLSVLRLIPEPPGRIVSGSVRFEGTDLLRLDPESLRRIRGSRVGMIFQEPLSSLNPVFTIGDQVAEAIRSHEAVSHRAARTRVVELLGLVNIANPRRIVDAYPHQLSGGMCQRVMLSMAIACRPRLLIADEPTTALDITTQAQLLELIRGLQADLGMAVIWITHDLGIVAGIADRVQVMYAGRIVESADAETLYGDPLHPYTLALLGCIPRLDAARSDRLTTIPGAPPDLVRRSVGCPFAPRCTFRVDRSMLEDPSLEPVGPGHARACFAPVEALRAGRVGPHAAAATAP
jgi:oligopeptide transport system ATP-binding protein